VSEELDHEFKPYDANPGICSVCGGVQPYGCYRIGGTPEAEAPKPHVVTLEEFNELCYVVHEAQADDDPNVFTYQLYIGETPVRQFSFDHETKRVVIK
jgi:hypothetical protein